MVNQNYSLVKYSYTTFFKQKHKNATARFSNIEATRAKYSDNHISDAVVGIKFDNISDGKLFTRIFNTQEQTIVKKEVSCNWLFLLAGNHVTKQGLIAEADECNEPTVLCQSTFH